MLSALFIIKKAKGDKSYEKIHIKKSSFDEIKPLTVEYVHKSFLYKLHIDQ